MGYFSYKKSITVQRKTAVSNNDTAVSDLSLTKKYYIYRQMCRNRIVNQLEGIYLYTVLVSTTTSSDASTGTIDQSEYFPVCE